MLTFLERFWSGCGHCRGQGSCPLAEAADEASAAGAGGSARYAWALSAAFLIPLLSGILGAYAAGNWPALARLGSLAQVLGMAGGMAMGVLAARRLVPRLLPPPTCVNGEQE